MKKWADNGHSQTKADLKGAGCWLVAVTADIAGPQQFAGRKRRKNGPVMKNYFLSMESVSSSSRVDEKSH